MSRQLAERPENEIVSVQNGRPTKYKKKYVGIAKDYLNNFSAYGDVIPSIVGLAAHLEVSRDTIYQWIKREVDYKFTDIVQQIKTGQERKLVNSGLSGDFNASITKLCLVSKHGYSENNQADSGVTINIDRSCGSDTVTVSKGSESVTIDQDTTA